MKSPLPISHLLYLHGFRSSPRSYKAQIMAHHMAIHHPDVKWACPSLPPSPKAAAELIDELTQDWPATQSAVMGSSLGGYYATWLMQKRDFRAVLLNPAVFPERDLTNHIGEHAAWHDPGQRIYFAPHYIEEFKALQPGPMKSSDRYLAILAKGDEVLDWKEMLARYPGPQTVLLSEGDHALSDFTSHLPLVLQFLGLKNEPPSLRAAHGTIS
jgi:predicted esterase YcpF (UPF0227 family)